MVVFLLLLLHSLETLVILNGETEGASLECSGLLPAMEGWWGATPTAGSWRAPSHTAHLPLGLLLSPPPVSFCIRLINGSLVPAASHPMLGKLSSVNNPGVGKSLLSLTQFPHLQSEMVSLPLFLHLFI